MRRHPETFSAPNQSRCRSRTWGGGDAIEIALEDLTARNVDATLLRERVFGIFQGDGGREVGGRTAKRLPTVNRSLPPTLGLRFVFRNLM